MKGNNFFFRKMVLRCKKVKILESRMYIWSGRKMECGELFFFLFEKQC